MLRAREVANLFGEEFVATLGKLPPGQWQGPVESGYGTHVGVLSERTEGGVPALGSGARGRAPRVDRRPAARDGRARPMQALLRKYAVTIEAPKASDRDTLEPVAARSCDASSCCSRASSPL